MGRRTGRRHRCCAKGPRCDRNARKPQARLVPPADQVCQRQTLTPADVAAIHKEINALFWSLGEDGRAVGSNKWGIDAFFDYDGEPIYVGQTYEGLGSRIGRHLTNQRTDAVAMNVLDPFEVCEIRVWPLDLGHLDDKEIKAELDRAEYTLFLKVIEESSFKAVLNEKA